jgi:hypothetical protein
VVILMGEQANEALLRVCAVQRLRPQRVAGFLLLAKTPQGRISGFDLQLEGVQRGPQISTANQLQPPLTMFRQMN